ncbi:MAG: 2Fe-2S iron-sulfur cluster-binding protein, partial [Bacteroidota bacterium]
TTSDCSVITLDVPIDQQADFAYKQGQYLTFKASINGEDLRRSYSLCSSPLDGEWQIAVKQIEDGRFSTYANEQLRKGDILEVLPPDGKFFVETNPEQERHYVAFAAGSGITPILSIIKTHLEQEPESTFELYYVNRTVTSIILKEEIEALKNEFLGRFKLNYFLTREDRGIPLFSGRIDSDKLDIICSQLMDPKDKDAFFICGPNDMIFLIRDHLKAIGVDEQKIHFELFNTSGLKTKKKKKPAVSANGKERLTEVLIKEGGKTIRLDIPTGENNILDAALEQNADLPFACKGGVCCTCMAKLVEGKVDMEFTYGLEPDEQEAGYILTCQAIPLTEKVVVDFDQ